ncbi:MAG: hypothetical protein GTO18_21675 [Anaerolineales bacterium]|nr:hypothetical protein [Anaerolineales bacterium]
MSKFRTLIRWTGFWIFWILLTVGGLVVDKVLFRGSGVTPRVISGLEYLLGSGATGQKLIEVFAAAILGIIDGIILGAFQWPALRNRLDKAYLWIPATALGTGLSLTIFWAILAFGEVDQYASEDLTDLVFELGIIDSFIGGVILGLAQWLVLRPRVLAAGLWVLTSMVAMVSGWLVRWFVSPALAMFVIGAVSGLGMTILLAASELPQESENSISS